MTTSIPQRGVPAGSGERHKRVGILVHPTRNVDEPLRQIQEWTERHAVDVVQVATAYPQRPIAKKGDIARIDLIISIGGDGTTLAALRAGAVSGRPVLGVACGSLGALANITAADVSRALDRFAAGEWTPRLYPALWVERPEGESLFALNDVALVRASGGQVRLSASIDGSLYARMAGDGAVVSTPIGSSGYAISAGGPLLLTPVDGYVFTSLPKHGGFAPPVVIASTSELVIDVAGAFAGARLEIDGQVAGECLGALTITFRPAIATQVSFEDEESLIAGLRRRRILLDSPRLMAEAARDYVNRPPAET
ncbi:MAG TPA: NAD(+)/NADH kinase [Solirubrobacteraceae bacterium]|nr:NAD(+)/NADH kinase [Solirubrobacteraceae bacterium]